MSFSAASRIRARICSWESWVVAVAEFGDAAWFCPQAGTHAGLETTIRQNSAGRSFVAIVIQSLSLNRPTRDARFVRTFQGYAPAGLSSTRISRAGSPEALMNSDFLPAGIHSIWPEDLRILSLSPAFRSTSVTGTKSSALSFSGWGR